MNTRHMPKPPRRDWTIIVLMLMLAALVVASFASLPLKWREFFTADAVRSTLELLAGFAPPETGLPFLTRTFWATLETLAMSGLGTLLAVIFGLAFSLPASGRFGAAPRAAMRAVLNVLRSIPELVWASIMLIAAGLGPLGGTLALAAHTAGVLGRLFADSLENAAPLPEQSLRTNGASATAAFFYATLPQTLPQMMSYTCTAGRTTSAPPPFSAWSAPAAWGRCSSTTCRCSRCRWPPPSSSPCCCWWRWSMASALPAPRAHPITMLELRQLSKSYNGRPVLDRLTWNSRPANSSPSWAIPASANRRCSISSPASIRRMPRRASRPSWSTASPCPASMTMPPPNCGARAWASSSRPSTCCRI
jgi:phosphonate transport system permease protein